MEVVNLLHLSYRAELRRWLEENHNKEKCCWVVKYRSKKPECQLLRTLMWWRRLFALGGLTACLSVCPMGDLRSVCRLAERKVIGRN